MAKQLTAAEAWTIIGLFGWGTKTTDYKKVSEALYAVYGKEEIKKLEAFVNARTGDLYNAVRNYEMKHGTLEVGSDDGFSDLCYHVVGLGQKEFEHCMADPTLLQKRHRDLDYTESFSYCFQEPEPKRTEADKEKTLEELATVMSQLNEKINALQIALDGVREKWNTLYRLGRIIQNDRKG